MTVYGKLSRLVANDRPRVYPPMPPSTRPTEETRWCWTGAHETRDPERWPNDKGCSKHPAEQPRKAINGWTVCAVCGTSRRPSSYLLGYEVDGAKVCDLCAVEKRL